MTYDEMLDYCNGNREADGFCRCSTACSGPCRSNLAADYPMPEGVTVYRGGNYGSCRFEVEEGRFKGEYTGAYEACLCICIK